MKTALLVSLAVVEVSLYPYAGSWLKRYRGLPNCNCLVLVTEVAMEVQEVHCWWSIQG